MRILSLLLLLLEVLAIFYPQAQRLYYMQRQAAVLEQWVASFPAEEAAEMEALSSPLSERWAAEGAKRPAPGGAEPLAVLLILPIDLEIPVYMGATRANLRRSAALLPGWALPGEAGWAVITAHRSHNYGMQFNRLDELAEGDEVLLRTRDGVYRYAVKEKKIARPEEVSLPRAGESGYCLALVTCHPLYSRDPSYRLVVTASME